jgi:23S rRNA-/tRNA-specific pseudouridylate synthase
MRPRDPEKGAPDVEVAYEDEDLLVLIKPPSLPTTSPDPKAECLATIARRLDPKAPRMHATSRLDRDVTGLVTFAKTDRAIQATMRARREGRYRRTYLALTSGVPLDEKGRWESVIAIDPRDATRRIVLAEGMRGERAQEARSSFERRASASGCSLLALFPETGRTHQLRVHASAAGFPILGDRTYGGPPRVVLSDGRVVSARRVMLHCARLSLPKMASKGELVLVSPVPSDFVKVWEGLGGEGGTLFV